MGNLPGHTPNVAISPDAPAYTVDDSGKGPSEPATR